MKPRIITLLLTFILALPLRAETTYTLQERLIEVELNLSSAPAEGLGAAHPQRKALESEFEALNKHPHIRNEKYWKLLSAKKIALEADLARLKASGYGAQHPKIQAVKRKLETIQTREAAKD